eukprot:GILK01004759.1.p1 GENE.GILK01004759.1~~GILK01004759.1.p1  ORF type:complete len:142 (+),score=18.68 GILK01004759.1:25-426(+)
MANYKDVTIYVEYCTSCGFFNRFRSFADAMESRFPNIEIKSNATPPRMKSFEIIAEHKGKKVPIYSKITTGRFPDNDIVFADIDRFVKTGKGPFATEKSGSSSNIILFLSLFMLLAALVYYFRPKLAQMLKMM